MVGRNLADFKVKFSQFFFSSCHTVRRIHIFSDKLKSDNLIKTYSVFLHLILIILVLLQLIILSKYRKNKFKQIKLCYLFMYIF